MKPNENVQALSHNIHNDNLKSHHSKPGPKNKKKMPRSKARELKNKEDDNDDVLLASLRDSDCDGRSVDSNSQSRSSSSSSHSSQGSG
jgi:hypothetical protein